MGFVESYYLAKILNKIQVVLIIGDTDTYSRIFVIEYVVPVSPVIISVIVDHIID